MIYLTRVDLEKGKRKNRGKNNIKGHQSKEYKGTPENTKGHPLSEIVRYPEGHTLSKRTYSPEVTRDPPVAQQKEDTHCSEYTEEDPAQFEGRVVMDKLR